MLIISLISLYCITGLLQANFTFHDLKRKKILRKNQCFKGINYNCKISLPQRDSQYCRNERSQTIRKAREWWNLNIPKKPGDPNPSEELLLPRLNHSYEKIALKAQFDPLDKGWFSLYYSMGRALNATSKKLAMMGALKKPMTSYAEYKEMYNIYKKTMNDLPAPHYYGLPVDGKDFTDTIRNELWEKDKYFVQRRLAGTCAHALKRVVDKGTNGFHYDKLLNILNPSFQWDDQIRLTVNEKNINLKKAVQQQRLFVLYHEEYNDLPSAIDILDSDPNDQRELLKKSTPVALFILNKYKDLEIVAIQEDSKKDAEVYTTPTDSKDLKAKTKWLIIKGKAELVDYVMCQIKSHLHDTHVPQEYFCNLFRRHLSTRHPLYELFESHCEGTTPVGELGIHSLVGELRYLHRIFHIGHLGVRKLINKLYLKQNYEDIDFENILKRQGLFHAKIRDYPYRDDGRIVWSAIKEFAKCFVSFYYKRDSSIRRDDELQGFVNELSVDGTAPNGAKYKGFPKKFYKREDLETLLARVIWNPVQHALNSAPLTPYSSYLPIATSKLYSDPRDEAETNYAYTLPNAQITMTQTALSFILSGIRVNRLFDYYKRMTDQKARLLVEATHTRLNTVIQKTLEFKNRKRFHKKDLTYQFVEPMWLPNSIHN